MTAVALLIYNNLCTIIFNKHFLVHFEMFIFEDLNGYGAQKGGGGGAGISIYVVNQRVDVLS